MINTYLILLRGINVGGKNKVSMSELRSCFEGLGFENVVTYINSGNVFIDTRLQPETVKQKIEAALPTTFKLDSQLIKVLVLPAQELEAVVAQAPKGFGTEPEKYYSDAVFLLGRTAEEAMEYVETNPDVDKVWPGKNVLYYRRLGAQRTKSRLGKIIGKPIYKDMTIRSWGTTTKLLKLLKARVSE